MKSWFVIIILLLTASLRLEAQNQIVEDTNFTSLHFVYGWYKNPNNGKWTTKEKEIKNIDKFKSYAISSYTLNEERYVTITKIEEQGSQYVYNTYSILFEDYKYEITKWENKTTIKLPISGHYALSKKKSENVKYEELVSPLTRIANLPTSYFVIQYKFDMDDVVKFLFYVEEFKQTKNIKGLNGKDLQTQDLSILGTDVIYNNFFYKTTYNAFVGFTDSPLKK